MSQHTEKRKEKLKYLVNCKNVDTEGMSEMISGNIVLFFPPKHSSTVSAGNNCSITLFFMVVFRYWQHMVKVRKKIWHLFNTEWLEIQTEHVNKHVH